MLQNPRVTAVTVSKLLKKNQQEGGGGKIPPTQIWVNKKVNDKNPEFKTGYYVRIAK